MNDQETKAPLAELLDGMSPARFVLRVSWVAVQLLLVYWCARTGDLFFYQGF